MPKKFATGSWPYIAGSVVCLLLTNPLVAGADSDKSAEPLPTYATLKAGNSLPSYEATWSLFMLVAALEGQEIGKGKAMLKDSVGLPDESSEALLRYIMKTVDAHHQRSIELMKRVCLKRDRLESRARLAAALRGVDQRLDRDRETDVANLSGVLEVAENEALSQWVKANLQPSMQSIKVDHELYFQAHESDPRKVLDELCAPYNVAAGL